MLYLSGHKKTEKKRFCAFLLFLLFAAGVFVIPSVHQVTHKTYNPAVLYAAASHSRSAVRSALCFCSVPSNRKESGDPAKPEGDKRCSEDCQICKMHSMALMAEVSLVSPAETASFFEYIRAQESLFVRKAALRYASRDPPAA